MSEERASPEELRDSADPWFHVIQDRTHFARSFCRGARVLDAPCGTGWSSALIAEVAGRVLGVDIDEVAIETAKQRRPAENLEFRLINCLALDVPPGSFDVAVSIEAIEHFSAADGPAYVAGLARALRPGGVLVGTTPSAPDAQAAEIRRIKEANPFHLKIYWPRELRRILVPHFDHVWIEQMPFGCFYFVAHKKLGFKEAFKSFTPASVRPLLTRGRGVLRRITGV